MSQDDGRYNIGSRRTAQIRAGVSEGRESTGGETDPVVLASLSDRFGVPAIDVEQLSFPTSNLELIPAEIARRQCVLPMLIRDDAIFLAMADPSDRRVIDELEFVSAKRVFPYAALREHLTAAIDRAYRARDARELQYRGPRASAGATTSVPPGAPHAPSVGVVDARGRASAKQPDVAMTDTGELGPDDGMGNAAPGAVLPPPPATGASPTPGPLTRLSVPAGPPTGALQGPSATGPALDSVFTPIGQVIRTAKVVLVVDDEEDIRKLLHRVLEGKGYQVVEADRGSTALAMVKQHSPDAIVLDAMLPELHGFDICRRIKASARYGHIPILMISAVYRGWRYAEDLKSAYGVNAYIEKPFRIAEVLAAIEELLAGAPKADERDPEALSADADAALAAGMAAYRAGEIDAAIAELERGIAIDPLSYRLHYHLALLVGRKDDVFRAIQELETAINLNPRSFPALKNLAVLYQRAGFRNKAIEVWERAIGQSPDDATRSQIKEHLMALL